MADYRITNLAQTDLEKIWEYTLVTWSSDQADKYLDDLLTSFESIAEGKKQGKPVNDIRPGYWRASCSQHYIFYRLGDDAIVEIIRVLHVRMDIESHL